VERVRESIEQSIVGLEEARRDTEGRRALVAQSIEELETLISKDKSLFSEYRDRILEAFKKTEAEQKAALAELVASLLLQEGGIKIALSGLNQRALRSSVLVFAPPNQPKANARRAMPALIEDIIPLPPVLSLRSKGVLEALYTRDQLSARTVSRIAGASRSGVLKALDRFGIPRNDGGRKRTGPMAFGFDDINHQLMNNGTEQAVISLMRQYRAGGLSLREIAGNLNQKLIPTKQNGIWQANTVRKILARA
jgi:hypothetical protein